MISIIIFIQLNIKQKNLSILLVILFQLLLLTILNILLLLIILHFVPFEYNTSVTVDYNTNNSHISNNVVENIYYYASNVEVRSTYTPVDAQNEMSSQISILKFIFIILKYFLKIN